MLDIPTESKLKAFNYLNAEELNRIEGLDKQYRAGKVSSRPEIKSNTDRVFKRN